jgi:hypothetical protein
MSFISQSKDICQYGPYERSIESLKRDMVENIMNILQRFIEVLSKIREYYLSDKVDKTNNPKSIKDLEDYLKESNQFATIVINSLHLFRNDYHLELTRPLITHFLAVSPIIRELLDVFNRIDIFFEKLYLLPFNTPERISQRISQGDPTITYQFMKSFSDSIPIIKSIKEPFANFALSLSDAILVKSPSKNLFKRGHSNTSEEGVNPFKKTRSI